MGRGESRIVRQHTRWIFLLLFLFVLRLLGSELEMACVGSGTCSSPSPRLVFPRPIAEGKASAPIPSGSSTPLEGDGPPGWTSVWVRAVIMMPGDALTRPSPGSASRRRWRLPGGGLTSIRRRPVGWCITYTDEIEKKRKEKVVSILVCDRTAWTRQLG
ncbi:hypothetical protein CPB84DRAFT_606827 [Gymnopilus junonius]|uniref:Secreted protein n=1 Tax=Gymnopilus junonius TaxID=109634 RepID=A0A9P5NBJ9_GYMJU|nr:hypothetical protein CPB84DRAFT_606827 [Gymnopilus junonius]